MWTSRDPQPDSEREYPRVNADIDESRNAERSFPTGQTPSPADDESADDDDASTAVLHTREDSTASPDRGTRARPARPARRLDRMPPWKVILHNDDVNDMGYVVETLMVLTPHSFESAYRCMVEAHLRGHALVLMTHQERAELYRDQFGSRLLTVTIEPDESE